MASELPPPAQHPSICSRWHQPCAPQCLQALVDHPAIPPSDTLGVVLTVGSIQTGWCFHTGSSILPAVLSLDSRGPPERVLQGCPGCLIPVRSGPLLTRYPCIRLPFPPPLLPARNPQGFCAEPGSERLPRPHIRHPNRRSAAAISSRSQAQTSTFVHLPLVRMVRQSYEARPFTHDHPKIHDATPLWIPRGTTNSCSGRDPSPNQGSTDV